MENSVVDDGLKFVIGYRAVFSEINYDIIV